MRILMALWRCNPNQLSQRSLDRTMVDCITRPYCSPTVHFAATTPGHVICMGHT